MKLFKLFATLVAAGFVGGCSSLSINLPGMEMGGMKMTPGPMQIDLNGGQPTDPTGVPVDPNGMPVGEVPGAAGEVPAAGAVGGGVPAGGGFPTGNGNGNGNNGGKQTGGKTTGGGTSGNSVDGSGGSSSNGGRGTVSAVKIPKLTTTTRKPLVLPSQQGSRVILKR